VSRACGLVSIVSFAHEFLTMPALEVAQALLYCHKVLSLDPSRQHVFAFVTDLDTCWLLNVKAAIVKEVSRLGVTSGEPPDSTPTVRVATVQWYDQQARTLPGLQVLKELSKMSTTDLGMSPLHILKVPVEQLKVLGHGSGGHVYSYRLEGEDYVLKIPKEGQTSNLETEGRALTHLNSSAGAAAAAPASASGMTLRSRATRGPESALKHIPQPLAPNSALALKHFQSRPIAQTLWHGNIQAHHPQELLDTLQMVHAGGWLHGDLSPNNIMLAPSNWRDGAVRPSCMCIAHAIARKPFSDVTFACLSRLECHAGRLGAGSRY